MAFSMALKGLKSTKNELNAEYTKLINQSQRISAFQATTELVYVTPVDSGRARSAWALNTSKELVDSQDDSFDQKPKISLGEVPHTEIETLYITNGTPYIRDLNAGSSLQAPARFIETTLSKYFKIKGTVARII